MTAISEKQRVRFYIYKKQKNRNVFIYKKRHILQKARQFCYIFIYKNQDTSLYAIFMKMLKLAFIYKNNDTLRHVAFLYRKIQTLRKNQDNLHYVFIYKNRDTLRNTIFYRIFDICGGGGRHYYIQKTRHLALHFYKKKTLHFEIHFTYEKPYTFRYIFLSKKQCTLGYVFISIYNRIVLIPIYKRTYNQSDQIKK